MNRQAKNRTLIIIFSFLLLLNIALLSFFIFFKDKKPHMDEKKTSYMSEYLKNDLNFSDNQLKQYDSLKAEHQESTKNLYDSIRSNKQLIFKQIGMASFADSSLENAAQYAATQQKTLELEMLKFLRKARNLGTADQQIKFDTSFYKVMSKNRRKPDNKKKLNFILFNSTVELLSTAIKSFPKSKL